MIAGADVAQPGEERLDATLLLLAWYGFEPAGSDRMRATYRHIREQLGAGDGLYCAMPLFHNSGRSAFNYAMAQNARFVLRDRFSATDFWSDVRATGCVTAALVGPMTALLYAAPRRDDPAVALRVHPR